VILLSKFNQKMNIEDRLKQTDGATTNYEGGMHFTQDPKTELFLRIATYLVSEPKFYEGAEQGDTEVYNLIQKVLVDDPEFVLKLAKYAREKLYLRSAPVMLLGEYAKSGATGIPKSRKYVTSTIQRPDEITELMAYTLNSKSGKIPSVIRYGIKGVFESGKFSEYQLAKYNRKGEVRLRDAMFLSRPRPKNEQMASIFKKLADNDLDTPETWETYISENGSNHETWSYIAPKLPYMALIRNLRNLVKFDVDPELYLDKITNEKAIKKSKMFPFRYYSAYKELEKVKAQYDPFLVSKVLSALERAIEKSVINLPKLPGKTLVIADVSWSMKSNYTSKRSTVSTYDIATLFAAMSDYISDESLAMAIANSFIFVEFDGKNILSNQSKMQSKESSVGIGPQTNVYLALEWLRNQRIHVDRIILLSDMQCYNSDGRYSDGQMAPELIKYQNSVNPKVKLYSVDLTGYGGAQFPKDAKGVSLLAGWSEKIFDYISLHEKDGREMVADIESVQP
jgi:hypothetical protein